MCGFLVVGSEEFKLQEFNDALDKAAYRGPDHQHFVFQKAQLSLCKLKILKAEAGCFASRLFLIMLW